MEEILRTLLTALVGGVIGGGVLAGIGYRALKDKLIEDFVEIFGKRSKVDVIEDRVTAFDGVAARMDDRIGKLEVQVLNIQQESTHRIRPFLEKLEQLIDRQSEQQRQLDQGVHRLETMERRIAQAEKRLNRRINGGSS